MHLLWCKAPFGSLAEVEVTGSMQQRVLGWRGTDLQGVVLVASPDIPQGSTQIGPGGADGEDRVQLGGIERRGTWISWASRRLHARSASVFTLLK